ncbi:MAG: hypothetical protein JO273_04310 [Methylobacteriaceae bacterium]|nr:hypothetical protein [Methylobacteriaceae bacterium]
MWPTSLRRDDDVARLAELSKITRERGKPYVPKLEGAALVEAFPGDWYKRWHQAA